MKLEKVVAIGNHTRRNVEDKINDMIRESEKQGKEVRVTSFYYNNTTREYEAIVGVYVSNITKGKTNLFESQ